MVAEGLQLPDVLAQLGGVVGQCLHTGTEGLSGDVGHLGSGLTAALQRNGGSAQQTLVQLGSLFGDLGIGDHLADQLLQQLAGGQQQSGTGHVEDGVADGNGEVGSALFQDGKVKQCSADHINDQADHGADDVEHQVNNCGTLCILGSTHGGQHCSHTGTDVLSHDDGNCSSQGDGAGGGQGLQDTDGCGGGLDDGGQDRTGHDTQDGVLEHDEQLLELGNIL